MTARSSSETRRRSSLLRNSSYFGGRDILPVAGMAWMLPVGSKRVGNVAPAQRLNGGLRTPRLTAKPFSQLECRSRATTKVDRQLRPKRDAAGGSWRRVSVVEQFAPDGLLHAG